MNVLVIEDELPAQGRLLSLLKKVDPAIHVAGTLGSVRESLEWLRSHPLPDLAFADILLSDDQSFEIFRKHPVPFPVVFVTAYDKHLLESLEFNSVDYLLKPVTEEKLRRALRKVSTLERHFIQQNLKAFLEAPEQGTRIVARKGTEFVSLDLKDIAYFFTEHKIVFARGTEGRLLIVDGTLAELEKKLDSGRFFRLNRKYIGSLAAINAFRPIHGKIQVTLNPHAKETVMVSKESAPAFRKWVGMKRERR